MISEDERVLDYSATPIAQYIKRLYPTCDLRYVSQSMIEAAKNAEALVYERITMVATPLEASVGYLRQRNSILKKALAELLKDEEE